MLTFTFIIVIAAAAAGSYFFTKRHLEQLWSFKVQNEVQRISAEKDLQIAGLEGKLASIEREHNMQLQVERESLKKQLEVFEASRANLMDSFKALLSESLQLNNRAFLELATQNFEKLGAQARFDLEKRYEQVEQTVRPVRESLEKFDAKINDLEKARVEAYSGIKEQFQVMREGGERLRLETANLVKALRAPQVRGRWGELQLRRVVEMAGMVDHCDFFEQVTVTDESARLRPDLVVKLPGGKNIVVDSKAVISSFIEAAQSEDETVKREKLAEHARHISERVTELSKKSYWDQFANSPEFVVLFLPGESFFSSALQSNPALIEQSVDQRVIIATPTTLIALLKAVAYGWKQTALAENAREIADLGKELYKRVGGLAENFSDLGRKLSQAVDSYNKSVGTLESRVLVSARRFHELKAISGDEEISLLEPIDKSVREPQAQELLPPLF